MLYNNVKVLVLTHKSFKTDPNGIEDVTPSNLIPSDYKEYLRASIVIYNSNGMSTIMKNAFGADGMIVPS